MGWKMSLMRMVLQKEYCSMKILSECQEEGRAGHDGTREDKTRQVMMRQERTEQCRTGQDRNKIRESIRKRRW